MKSYSRGYQGCAAELRFLPRWHRAARVLARLRVAEVLPAARPPAQQLQPGKLYEVVFGALTAVSAVDQAALIVVSVGELGRGVPVAEHLAGEAFPLVALV